MEILLNKVKVNKYYIQIVNKKTNETFENVQVRELLYANRNEGYKTFNIIIKPEIHKETSDILKSMIEDRTKFYVKIYKIDDYYGLELDVIECFLNDKMGLSGGAFFTNVIEIDIDANIENEEEMIDKINYLHEKRN